MKVGIVGGGVAGLTAAYELLRKGASVVLFEPGPLGGLVQSRLLDGFTVENGPNVLVERPHLTDLIDTLELRKKVLYPAIERYQQFVWCDGRPQLVPKSPIQLFKSDLFSLSTKLALPIRLIKRGLLRPSADDVSVLQFFTPLLGRTTAQALLDPVLKGIYGGDVDLLSARTLFPQLWEVVRGGGSLVDYLRAKKGSGAPKVLTFEGGVQTLTDGLWSAVNGQIDVVRESVVEIVPQEQSGFVIFTPSGGSFSVDKVVLTPGGKRLAQVLERAAPTIATTLAQLHYASLAMCHVAVPASDKVPSRAFGVLFPAGMKHHLLGVMYKSVVFPSVAPAGKHLLSVVLGGAQAGDFSPSEDELRQWVKELLAEFFRLADVEWLGCKVWKEAIPQLAVGHFKVVEMLNSLERQIPGLVLCGVDRGGVGVSDRIKAAQDAVERLLAQSV